MSDIDDAGKLVFKGPSPDDEALVEFARDLGFVFKGATDQIIRIQQHGSDEILTFDLYRRMEFNSDRKRASILVRDPTDCKIKLYVKGADNVIEDRLAHNQSALVRDHMLEFTLHASRQGLRTLFFAMKVMKHNELV
jgi:magnesium-transporting ATPase (P-type)